MNGRSPFDWNTGEPTVFNTNRARQYADRKVKQTAHVEKRRKEGVDIGAVHGISRAGDERMYEYIKRAP